MYTRRAPQFLFGLIFVVLAGYSLWASLQQPLWEWRGLTRGEDRWWTIATLIDAYCGFLTFFVWVCCKERSNLARAGWFVAIMLLGNIATSAYVLLQLRKLGPREPLSSILWPARPAHAPE